MRAAYDRSCPYIPLPPPLAPFWRAACTLRGLIASIFARSKKGDQQVMRKVALFGILAGFTGVLGAQEFPRFSFSAGAGFTSPVGRTSANVDTGWNIKGSAGVNFSRFAGVNLEGGYDSLGIGTNVMSNLGYGGGRLS